MKINTADPETARIVNRLAILNRLRRSGPASRAELSRELKLSKVTISSVVDDLIKKKLVIEQQPEKASIKGGRKPIPISLNDNYGVVLGVDIGTTNLIIAAGNLQGKIIAEKKATTLADHNLEGVINQIVSLIMTLIEDVGIKLDEIMGVGVSVAGIIDRPSGVINISTEFHWRDVPLQEILAEKLGFPVILDNCTRAMAMGEIYYGDAIHEETVFYVNVGYGIGSAIIINGKIYEGHSEFGHTIIKESDQLCNCGKKGCLTTLASGHAIERMANENLKTESENWITAEVAAGMAATGDSRTQHILEMAGKDIGRGIAIAANLLNPDRIIIGGGVIQAGDLFTNPLKSVYDQNTMDVIKNDAALQISELGNEAGLLGALALALNASVFQIGFD